MAVTHLVTIGPLPLWLDAPRLLGLPADGLQTGRSGVQHWKGRLVPTEAGDVQARLRGVGFDGAPVEVSVQPSLPRPIVRNARTVDARRRRDTSPGFSDPRARLDEEGRYSLTPEALSLWMGRAAQGRRVVDACCGLGGNAIGFARAGCEVVAIEQDSARLELARYNVGLYGVDGRVRFVNGDARQLVPEQAGDIVFIDPPWGGAYDRHSVLLEDLSLLAPLLSAASGFDEVWLKLPPSFDCRQLPWAQPTAVFGHATGDFRRVKFLWLRGRVPTQPEGANR